jgi:hypothetical protein
MEERIDGGGKRRDTRRQIKEERKGRKHITR